METQKQGGACPAPSASDSQQLAEQIKRLTEDNQRMEKVEAEIMRLLKTTARERILHDLRNVLNELVLLQALLQSQDEKK